MTGATTFIITAQGEEVTVTVAAGEAVKVATILAENGITFRVA
ncbi:hypothetical protein ACFOWE_18035 [Planomonospora corallina]|uniref:Uncharacterized protein n=1 Tax=Planomonospora corallina TaxID=1806052 RepID=A0ABV8ICH4_9ACTN